MKKILIIGATSAIATACAKYWASEQTEFFLVARNSEKLKQTADDLIARGSMNTTCYTLDLNQFDQYDAMLTSCFQKLDTVDIALIAHGTLADQEACEKDVNLTLREISNNGLSVIAILTLLSNRMEEQHFGSIAVISSVAGDRGRASNYIYGAAKAAVTTFCDGLRGRLYKTGVHVLTIKPGFVDTPMTKGLPLPRLLLASPEKVAQDICDAIKKQKNVIYTPCFWVGIMFIIKSIPNFIFKRLPL